MQSVFKLVGQVAVLVATALDRPHVEVVVGTRPSDGALRVTKEFWGGITGDYEVTLPAVLGVQAAREAPRYVAVSRVRQAQQEGNLEERDVAPPGSAPGVTVTEMRIPEAGEGAEMIEGDEAAAADAIVEILRRAGVA